MIPANPRYTGRQVWNRQPKEEILLDVEDVALGFTTRQRWNDQDRWICSEASSAANSSGRGSVTEDSSRAVVELVLDGEQMIRRVSAEVGGLREVVAEEPVHVLVRAALPGRVTVAEVDRCAQRPGDRQMAGHLGSLVPGDQPQQWGRQPPAP